MLKKTDEHTRTYKGIKLCQNFKNVEIYERSVIQIVTKDIKHCVLTRLQNALNMTNMMGIKILTHTNTNLPA